MVACLGQLRARPAAPLPTTMGTGEAMKIEELEAAERAATKRTRPILFSAPMVRAILAGTKTQTRRIVNVERVQRKGTRDSAGWRPFNLDDAADRRAVGDNVGNVCPYGEAGDRLYVRETWRATSWDESDAATIQYRSDNAKRYVCIGDSADDWIEREAARWEARGAIERDGNLQLPDGVEPYWRPAIFMPRGASRIT